MCNPAYVLENDTHKYETHKILEFWDTNRSFIPGPKTGPSDSYQKKKERENLLNSGLCRPHVSQSERQRKRK